jgi:A/G-specific adenine glycosylase
MASPTVPMALARSLPDATGEANRELIRARRALLAWYRPRRSAYPWRGTADPYEVLVSEVMLQQTQAARVALAYPGFIQRFPTVRSLAEAPLGEVVRAWGTLGYPRRAVALHRAARAVVDEHSGQIPSDPEVLVSLPGVGPYTAAAVAALGHGRRVPALDTNVRRVVARSRLGTDAHRATGSDVAEASLEWMGRSDPRAFHQALMDLGRELCRPRPRCDACPLRLRCAFLASGRAPNRAPRRQAPFRGSLREVRGAVLAVLRERGKATVSGLTMATGAEPVRVRDAVRGLATDGVVVAGMAALAGRPGGRVRLPD